MPRSYHYQPGRGERYHMRVDAIREALRSGRITHVLLDMDGTLLDKYFDDYFWGHLVPQAYADRHHMTFGRAQEVLFEKYKAQEGTLNWTDVDYWSDELDLDIMALKEQIRHLIEVHPHVERFLAEMNERGKRVYIVTNAHYKVLDVKLRKTELGAYLAGALTSFEIGYPKEDVRFWAEAARRLGFHKDNVLFVDDTLEVLRTARRYGIPFVLYKARSSSREEAGTSAEFVSINDFDELL